MLGMQDEGMKERKDWLSGLTLHGWRSWAGIFFAGIERTRDAKKNWLPCFRWRSYMYVFERGGRSCILAYAVDKSE